MLSEETITNLQSALSEWKEHYSHVLGFDAHCIGNPMEEDPSGLILAGILRGGLDRVTQQISFSLEQILQGDPEIAAHIDRISRIRKVAFSEEVELVMTSTKELVLDAAESLGARRKVLSVLDSPELYHGFRSAWRELRRLQAHQFVQGDGRGEKFHINEWIYSFDSMDELVHALAAQQTDGLTLCILFDSAVPEYSIFAWALRTGPTLTVLVQRSGLCHQGQKHLRRNPGRDFERRQHESNYPYSIFQFEEKPTASGSGTQWRIQNMAKDGVFESNGKTEMVRHSLSSHRVKLLKDLEAEEIVWLILVASCIHQEYWLGEKKTEELSYTGEMLSDPERLVKALIAPDTLPLLPCADPSGKMTVSPFEYQILSLGGSRIQDIKEDAEGPNHRWRGPKDVGGRTGVNDWLAHRYEEGFAEVDLAVPEITAEPSVSLAPFSARRLFGTKDKLRDERLFVARQNQARLVSQAARKEFIHRAPEIVQWFAEKVKSNLERLFDLIAAGEALVPAKLPLPSTTFSNVFVEKDYDILTLLDSHQLPIELELAQRMAVIPGEVLLGGKACCPILPELKVKRWAVFRPRNALGVALLAGVKVEDLPDVIQPFDMRPEYRGNSILDFLDPMESIRNPWDHLKFRVDVGFSNRGLAAWKRERKGNFAGIEVGTNRSIERLVHLDWH
jgi:hypothetical protein